jgi:acetylornithine aminotransferase
VAGVFEPTAEVWQVIDEVSKQTGTLFIADEIQSGCGRTGTYFAFQHWGVTPDLITMAKGIGNGFPVAGVLVHPEIVLTKGQLGTTFGGSYLACAALGAVLTELESGEIMNQAVALSNELKLQLLSLEGVQSVRGRGWMLGIELKMKAVEVQELLLKYGIICGTSACKHTLRILPPLTITQDEMVHFAETFRTVMDVIAVPERLAEP